MERVARKTCAAMPAWRARVAGGGDRAHALDEGELLPEGIGTGSQRIGAGGTSTSAQGAVRHSPASAFRNWPQFATVGRMR